MRIKNIKLENIRNYEKEFLEFEDGFNIIIGKNAQGKTNLLESIYITSFSKSFRTNNDKEIISFEKKFGNIVVNYEKEEEENRIEYFINNLGEKVIKINGIKIKKLNELVGNIMTVIFYPEDLKIIKEDPEKRRSFINREMCQLSLSYYNNLYSYNKILFLRNKYLKEKTIKKELLEVWTEELIKYGKEIIKERKIFINKLNHISKKIYNNIKKNEDFYIKYESNIKDEEKYKEIMEESLNNDILYRTTTKGPHKDDLKIFINNIDARKFGSQGQQRTAALSLKLAEIEIIKEIKKENPIILLDDVFSDLDDERQEFSMEYLKDLQVFITTTSLSSNMMKLVGGKKNIFHVENGKIKKETNN